MPPTPLSTSVSPRVKCALRNQKPCILHCGQLRMAVPEPIRVTGDSRMKGNDLRPPRLWSRCPAMQTVWNRLPVRRLSLRTAHSALTQPSTRGPEPPRAPAEDPAGPLSIGTLRILPLKRASLPRPSSSSGPSHADMKVSFSLALLRSQVYWWRPLQIFFITVLLAGNALAEFTPDFADFLAGTFGPAVKDQMER